MANSRILFLGVSVLGAIVAAGGWFLIISNFCLWYCSPAQQGRGVLGLFGLFGGIVMATLGIVAYVTAKPSPGSSGSKERR